MDDFGLGSSHHDILNIRVDQVDGHSPLMITAFFDGLTDKSRREAEIVYLRRRPFAVGYFRLWQLQRTQLRRIAALEATIDLLEIGVMLVDRTGAIVFCNDAGRRVLDSDDGLRRRHNSIRAAQIHDDVRLQVALDHVIGSSSAPMDERPHAPILSIKRKDSPSLIVSVMPASKRAIEPNDVAAAIYVLDPALDTEKLLQPICKLYSLTPVETKLACRLVGGASISEAAVSMRVKELTARSCLKQVFAKTGTHRQADLVRLMLSSLIRTTGAIVSEVL